MTPTDIEAMVSRAREAKELAEQATPGPWEVVGNHWVMADDGMVNGHGYEGEMVIDDSKFVAASRTGWPATADDVLALVAEVERLRGLNGTWSQMAADGLAEADRLRAAITGPQDMTADPSLEQVCLRLRQERDHYREVNQSLIRKATGYDEAIEDRDVAIARAEKAEQIRDSMIAEVRALAVHVSFLIRNDKELAHEIISELGDIADRACKESP